MRNVLKFGVTIFVLLFFIFTFAGCSGSTDIPNENPGNTETPDDGGDKGNGENGDDKGEDNGDDKGDDTNNGYNDGNIAVTGVSLDVEKITLKVNRPEQVTATVYPKNASDQRIEWITSDETIVGFMNLEGLLIGLAKGKAVVTVVTVDGNKTASCEVEVIASDTEKFNGPYLIDSFLINIKDYYIFDDKGYKIGEVVTNCNGLGDIEIRIYENDPPITYTAKLNPDGTLDLTSVQTFDENGDIKTVTAAMLTFYSVHYFYENADDDEYTENISQFEAERMGFVGDTTSVTADGVDGFQEPVITQVTLTENEKNFVIVEYPRKIIECTFDLNNGTGTETTVSGKYGSPVTAPANPTKTGYTFKCWKKVGTEEALPSTFPATNETYTAVWAPATDTRYTVKHLFENVAGTDYEENSGLRDVKTGTTNANTSAIAKNISGFTAQTVSQKTIAPDGSTVVEIKYTRDTIYLKFDLAGGTGAVSVSGKYGSPVTAPANPTKTGYTFKGWKKIGTEEPLPSTFPATNETYSAIWKPNSVGITVTINPQSDITAISVSENKATGTVTLTAPGGYTKYAWRVDGVLQVSANDKNTLTLNVSELDAGIHQVFVMVDNMYSSTISVTVKK